MTWTAWLAWKFVAFVFGCIWGFIRFFIFDIPAGVLTGIYNGGAYVVNKALATKSEKIRKLLKYFSRENSKIVSYVVFK